MLCNFGIERFQKYISKCLGEKKLATKMTRTSTGLPQLGPEPSASTNSAMVAQQSYEMRSISKTRKLKPENFAHRHYFFRS